MIYYLIVVSLCLQIYSGTENYPLYKGKKKDLLLRQIIFYRAGECYRFSQKMGCRLRTVHCADAGWGNTV